MQGAMVARPPAASCGEETILPGGRSPRKCGVMWSSGAVAGECCWNTSGNDWGRAPGVTCAGRGSGFPWLCREPPVADPGLTHPGKTHGATPDSRPGVNRLEAWLLAPRCVVKHAVNPGAWPRGQPTHCEIMVRSRGPHKAIGLYAHITWHTWRRAHSIAESDVAVVVSAVQAAAERMRVRIHAQAMLGDHVHLVVSYASDVRLSDFVRDAKSESARRDNVRRTLGPLRWCRGYYANSLSRRHVRAARVYVTHQRTRHPDRLPLRVG